MGLALLGRRPPLSSVSGASHPGGQNRDPKGSATCPTGHLAHQKLPLTGPRGSAVKGDEQSPPAVGPKGIPRPEGARRPACTRRGPSRPHSLPSQRFHALFDSLSKVLFIFPSRYLFTIGLVPVALDGVYHPLWAAIPNNPTLRRGLVSHSQSLPRTGLSPSLARLSSATSGGRCREGPSPDYNSPMQRTGDYRLGLFPLHSPLLGESWLVSFPPLINMLIFSGSPHLT